MMERVQYALILLLFVLMGSIGNTSPRSDAGSVQPALSRSVVADSSAAVRNYLSATICVCDATVEAPAVPTDHKAVVRQRLVAHAAASEAADVSTVMRTRSRALHVDAVDYYVFSLGRILI